MPSDGEADGADVVVVGPAGSAARIFTARYEFETVVSDRVPSSLDPCESWRTTPNFPAASASTTRSTPADRSYWRSSGAGGRIPRRVVSGAVLARGSDVAALDGESPVGSTPKHPQCLRETGRA